jgi:prepilin-type N-terminal cleavage/methylation domain-containing protein
LAADPRSAEAGFTLVEVLVAILLLGLSALSLGMVLASATRYSGSSETRQDLAHRAQQEVERLSALSFDRLALTAAPATSTNPGDPRYWYIGTSTSYRWDRTAAGASTAEPVVVDATNGTVGNVTTWSSGRSSGSLYAFITWVHDTKCGSGCPASQNYKRITVAATLSGGGELVEPVFVSTVVADPHALPAGKIINGNANPLSDPTITCNDAAGNTVSCTSSVGSSNVSEWYLTDTPAANVYAAPTASHSVHPTVAATGTCSGATTTGCPKPDLLSTAATPSGAVTPPLLDYSSDLAAAGYTGGRLLKRDVTCSATPTTTDNAKGGFWASAPLTAPMVLTGSGGMTLVTQTAGAAAAAVTLCLGVYDVPNSIANLVVAPPTRLGVVAYTVASWPTTPTPISFSFDFLTGSTVTLAAGHRLGVRLWAAAESGADIAALYDHPSYASTIQLNST